jgi:hypothetical protein
VSARSISKTGGQGTSDDVDLVVSELERWPAAKLAIIESQSTKVVVCRNSITDYRLDLKGVKPRGWPPGSTWDTVPGVYLADRNEVVIATIGHAAGSPHVPKTGEGHGSFNLVVHESGHSLDLAASSPRSSEQTFTDARTKDLATLSAYESQAAPAGPQETFAESAARFYCADPTDATTHTNLHGYWAGGGPVASRSALDVAEDLIETAMAALFPFAAPGLLLGIALRRALAQGSPPPPTLGWAALDANKSIHLHLRATDGNGAVGCAKLVYGPDQAIYGQLLANLRAFTSSALGVSVENAFLYGIWPG